MSTRSEQMPIPTEILDAFSVRENPVVLEGGQGSSFRAGSCVLKWSDNSDEANLVSNVMSRVTENGFRVARPVKTGSGEWVYKGWSAFELVEGKEIKGRWREKISVSIKFHQALAQFPRPAILDRRTHPWSIADRMIWQETPLVYGPQIAPAMSRLESLMTPISAANQLIHGDMGGNILFDEGLPPAIIDFSPYWRPAEYATAIIIVDSIVWEGADDALINDLENTSLSNQLLLRAAMWRIKTTEEYIRQYGRGSFEDVKAYSHFIELLEMRIESQRERIE